MKIPGPMIAVLIIIVLLFCVISGLGLQGSLNLINFDSAQDAMSGDMFSFLRPKVAAADIVNPPSCLVIGGTPDDPQLSEIALAGTSCALSIRASDTPMRTLPLRFIAGEARVSFAPASEDDENALPIDDRAVNSGRTELNVAISNNGGTVTVTCLISCRVGIEN